MRITIECESFEELFNYVQKVAGTAWEAPAPAEPKKTRAKKSETTQALPTAAPAEPTPAPAPAPEIMPAPVPETPAVTREACAKAAANLMRTNPAAREQLKGILTGYGVNSIPTIPKVMLPDFAEKIRALGGTV